MLAPHGGSAPSEKSLWLPNLNIIGDVPGPRRRQLVQGLLLLARGSARTPALSSRPPHLVAMAAARGVRRAGLARCRR